MISLTIASCQGEKRFVCVVSLAQLNISTASELRSARTVRWKHLTAWIVNGKWIIAVAGAIHPPGMVSGMDSATYRRNTPVLSGPERSESRQSERQDTLRFGPDATRNPGVPICLI
jgi:hypothetical protein